MRPVCDGEIDVVADEARHDAVGHLHQPLQPRRRRRPVGRLQDRVSSERGRRGRVGVGGGRHCDLGDAEIARRPGRRSDRPVDPGMRDVAPGGVTADGRDRQVPGVVDLTRVGDGRARRTLFAVGAEPREDVGARLGHRRDAAGLRTDRRRGRRRRDAQNVPRAARGDPGVGVVVGACGVGAVEAPVRVLLHRRLQQLHVVLGRLDPGRRSVEPDRERGRRDTERRLVAGRGQRAPDGRHAPALDGAAVELAVGGRPRIVVRQQAQVLKRDHATEIHDADLGHRLRAPACPRPRAGRAALPRSP